MSVTKFCESSGFLGINVDSKGEQRIAANDLKSQIDSVDSKIRASQNPDAAEFVRSKWDPFYRQFTAAYANDGLASWFTNYRSEICGFYDQYRTLLVEASELDDRIKGSPDSPPTSFDLWWKNYKGYVYAGAGLLTLLVIGPPIIRLISARRKGRDVLDVSAQELETLRSGLLRTGQGAASAVGRGAAAVGRGAKSAARGITKGGLMVAAPEFAPITAVSGAPKRRRRKSRR
jgi:hypothetical protein